MFTRISTKNFKSWQDAGEVGLASVTGFFGSNSSGKTSLLQTLLLLKQTVDSADRRQVLNLGGDERSPISLGLVRDVTHRGSFEAPMSFGFGWTPPERVEPPDPRDPDKTLFSADAIWFGTTLTARDRNGSDGSTGEVQLYVEQFEYSLGSTHVQMTTSKAPRHRRDPEYKLEASVEGDTGYLTRFRGRGWALPPPGKCYGFPDEVFAYYQNAEFMGDIELELERQFRDRLFYLGPLRSYPERQYTWQGSSPADVGRAGERAVEALLASRSMGRRNARKLDRRGRAVRLITVEEHVAQWLQQLQLIADFEVERISAEADIYRVRVRRSDAEGWVHLTDVGFGVSQVLPVLVLLAYVDEGSTVLLEQPEIHLHPAVQAGLADIIIEASSARRVQVIVESHSEHLLKRLQRRVAERRIAPDQVALYFCESSSGASRIGELVINEYGEIRNWPDDFFGDRFGETAAIVEAGLKQRAASDL
ncbi:AAA family ATPase [Candidatus Poriferisodalis sp.]|uniref:AAA family ATPase n=1 Tax=Candidatus Poriferisodalis sp. TaxID=3101277 RepID=UPI003B011045